MIVPLKSLLWKVSLPVYKLLLNESRVSAISTYPTSTRKISQRLNVVEVQNLVETSTTPTPYYYQNLTLIDYRLHLLLPLKSGTACPPHKSRAHDYMTIEWKNL